MGTHRFSSGISTFTNLFIVSVLGLNAFLTPTSMAAALVEVDNDPHIEVWHQVWHQDVYINAYDWPLDTTLTLEIEDPGTLASPDYSTTATVGAAPWDPNQTLAEFWLGDAFTIEPGMTVTVSGDSVTRELLVTNLTITGIDLDADTITGNAEVNQFLWMHWINNPDGHRELQADGSGNWIVNYRQVGLYGEPIQDIQIGSAGNISASDDDGDINTVYWEVFNSFDVWCENDHIRAYEWPLGTTLNLEIEDPGTPESPDYTTTTTVGVAPWNPDETLGEFGLSGVFDIQPGMTILLSSASINKALLVDDLTITSINPDTETIAGTAEPNQWILVHWDHHPDRDREFQADSSGNWTVDFRQPGPNGEPVQNIQPGSSGSIKARDSDWDYTAVYWYVPNPHIIARTNFERIEGHKWDVGISVTLKIDDPDNGPSVDYTDTQTVGTAPWDPSRTYVEFSFDGVYDLQPGDAVSLTDGSTTKELIVTVLEITDINPVSDVVTGVAAPSSEVIIWACWDDGGCTDNRIATADGSGNWSTDFSDGGGGQPTYDITLGTWVDSGQWEDDGDGTMYGENVPNPIIVAQYPSDLVTGRGWEYGTSVTLEVDDPDNGPGVDFSETQTVGWAPFNPSLTYVEFDISSSLTLGPGLQLSMTDGILTKEHTTVNLEVTSVDMASDVITCTSDPNADLNVYIYGTGGIGRHEQADGSGNWSADFSVPGDEDWENNTYDIQSDDVGAAIVYDSDSDETRYIWYAPPIVSSITRAGPSPTGASSVDYTVTFAEEVTGVTADDFTIYTTGSITGYSVTGVNGSGDTYTVTVATGMYNGTLRLDVNASGTGIQDLNGADLEGGFTSGEIYTVSKIYTLTVKSQARYDGWVRESGEFTGRGGVINKLGTILQVGDDAADRQYRSILSFSTEKIPDNAIITRVTLKVKRVGVVGTNPMSTHNALVVDIRKGKFYTKFALQIQDFQATASRLRIGKFPNRLYSGWYRSVLYSAAFPYINVKGLTQFRLRFLLDDNDDNSADILKLYSGNAGKANRPQLIVKYYVP